MAKVNLPVANHLVDVPQCYTIHDTREELHKNINSDTRKLVPKVKLRSFRQKEKALFSPLFVIFICRVCYTD